MPTTANLSLPYPDPSAAPNVPADIQAIAQALDVIPGIRAGANMGTPASTSSSGTVTSGTTETRDAVLGNYVFTAVASRRYRAVLDGCGVGTSVADDAVCVRIRNGGGSTPTSASTLIASARGYVLGTLYDPTLPVAGSFVPGAGTVTLSAFTVRLGGTGVETPSGSRQLYVVDLGPA